MTIRGITAADRQADLASKRTNKQTDKPQTFMLTDKQISKNKQNRAFEGCLVS